MTHTGLQRITNERLQTLCVTRKVVHMTAPLQGSHCQLLGKLITETDHAHVCNTRCLTTNNYQTSHPTQQCNTDSILCSLLNGKIVLKVVICLTVQHQVKSLVICRTARNVLVTYLTQKQYGIVIAARVFQVRQF